jgi:hypothetical protein
VPNLASRTLHPFEWIHDGSQASNGIVMVCACVCRGSGKDDVVKVQILLVAKRERDVLDTT